MTRNITETICSQCGMINTKTLSDCSYCGSDLIKISMIYSYNVKQLVLINFVCVPLLWLFLLIVYFDFFGLVKLKQTTPILRLVSNLIITLFVVIFSYLFIKLSSEWHIIGLTDNGFKVYLGHFIKIVKISNYRYSEIEIYCKLITPKFVSITFKVKNTIGTDSFVTKNIELGKKIIDNLIGEDISAQEFEKRFSIITGY